MKKQLKRLFTALLCVVMALGILPAMPMEAEAANHGLYKDLALVTNLSGSGCPSMQGLAICGSYFYAVKTDGDDYAATVCRVHRVDGTKTWMTNTANNSNFFYDFGHGNDVEVVEAGGTVNMFVPTSTKGSNSLVRYTISGTKATKHSGYTMMHNGSQISGGAIRAVRVDDENIYLLFKCGDECYYTTLPINQVGGTLEMTYLCTLDYSTAVVNGVAQDVSDWSLQGMGYYDHMLYLPLSSHTTSDWSMSIVLVYDLEGASGTIKPLDDPTFKITSGAYAALFEMESCVINPYDGRLYFSTNRRVSSSDTNHDGISYITNWVYEPDKRTSEVKDYRWEVQDGKLMSVTSEGSSYNGLAHHGGSINGTNLTDAQYTTAQNINLEHDRPWVLEWRSNAFSAGSLMFATYRTSGYTNNAYVFNRVDNVLISMGYHDGSQYNNYGINPQDYGIDTSVTHTYRLSNKIASDGSNMVYLSVDGTELGALNNYYIASTYQGTTSNWISGKDFSFSYLGTSSHPVNLDGLEYIQVWGDGIPAEDKDSNLYRWETSGNALNAVTGGNTLNKTSGTVSGTTFTGAQYDLTKDITLFHDRSWSIEWEGSYSSGTMLLAADHMGNTECAPYLYRSGVVAFGERKNGNHHNYGIKLSDYGISYADNHVYKLVNRLNADGSNMVYLFVDGKEIGPMNQYFTGTTATGTTVNWLSGRDLTFSYIGTYQYKLAGNMNYLQVDEGNCGHIYGPWSESNETCEADGTRSRTCTLCGNVETETVPATGHSYKTTVTAPTCTAKGYTTYTCACGHSYVADYVNATGHSYSSKVTTAPGCESAGVRTYTCSKCGDSYTESIAPVGHSYKTTVTAPTCTERGYTTYTCACGDSYVADYVDATGHSYSSKVTTAPGCESTGVRTYTCGKCGDSYTEIIAATGHTYDLIVTEPTCENKGYTTYVCACGSSFVGGYTDPIGHSWDKGVTTKSPTCTANGVKTFTCGTCGATKTESIAANGHSYVNGKCSTCGTYQCEEIGHNYTSVVTAPTCTTKGYTTYTCSICKDTYISNYVGAQGHSYDNGIVTKQPTCTATGTKTYTCSKCGDSYTESIAANGHSYVNGVCSVCGAKDPDYVEVVIPTITLKTPTLLLEDTIKLNIYYTIDQDIALEKMGMLTWSSKPDVVDIATAENVYPGATFNDGNGFYGVNTDGIPAQNLGDIIYFCIYAELADGSIVYGKQVQYSPVTYAYNQLKGGATAEMKSLLVAILNYGAAAQTYLEDTDPLVNANLTDDMKALVEAYRSDMVHSVAMPSASKQGAMAANGGFSAKKPSISLDGAFSINYYFTPSATVKGNMTFYYWNAEDFANASVLSAENATGSAVMTNNNGEYSAAISGIAAKDIDGALYACGVYTDVDGNTYSTGILPYSLGFYCGNQAKGTGALADLAASIAVYGYYASIYFAL